MNDTNPIAEYIIGIDPGITGGIAILHHSGKMVEAWPMPKIKPQDKKAKVCPLRFHDLLSDFKRFNAGRLVCYYEDVHAFPGQGVVSMFNFGDSLGVARSIAAIFADLTMPISASRWKGLMNVPKDKKAALTMARNMWPNASLNKVKDHGIAEALLIAECGRRIQFELFNAREL